ncbi:MAG TPA: hypothetical protein VGH63_05030 [Polyangia bacterium]
MSGDLAMMVVRMRDFDLGLAAERVREVVLVEQWGGDLPPTLAQLVGAEETGDTVRVLLIMRPGREPLATLVSGTVRLRHVAPGELLALPALLARQVRRISHVVVTDGEPPLLVVDVERLTA